MQNSIRLKPTKAAMVVQLLVLYQRRPVDLGLRVNHDA